MHFVCLYRLFQAKIDCKKCAYLLRYTILIADEKGGIGMMVTTHSFYIDGLCCNHKISNGQGTLPLHAHDLWELIYVEKGKLIHKVNGKVYHVEKDSLIITRPMDYHVIEVDAAEGYDRFVVNFREDFLVTDICKKLPQGVDVVNCEDHSQIGGLFRKMCRYTEQFEEDLLTGLVTHLIEEILCNALLIVEEQGKEETKKANCIVSRSLHYIRGHITRPITMEELADYCHITKGYLHHVFVRYMKTTPKKFIIAQKLTLARQDLCTGMKAKEVCAKYSFPDYSSFYRQYMQKYGHKPSEAEKNRGQYNEEF